MHDPITIEHNAHGDRQGVVQPASGRWQLVVDREGYPHLYVQVNIEGDDGQLFKGLLCLDDMLPEGLSMKDLMDGGSFGGKVTLAEEQDAARAYEKNRADRGIPCPK